MKITRIGGPTVLVELHGWRILVDPTFDPPGRRYGFGPGASSVKKIGPAWSPDELGPIDAILLSHDQHGDNLDDAGREMLKTAPVVVTTRRAAARLGLPHGRGLTPGESTILAADGKVSLEVTATPCRHGPPLSRPIVGDVIGFTVGIPNAAKRDVWISGDTVLSRELRATARQLDVDVAIVNAGGVRFGITGPIRYSMSGAEVVRLVRILNPRIAVPVHYDGWSHFRDGEVGMLRAIGAADSDVSSRFRMLPPGETTELSERFSPDD
ncbi:MAG: MBL fold metallo-hydrolase [Pseudolysinimonas sp.]